MSAGTQIDWSKYAAASSAPPTIDFSKYEQATPSAETPSPNSASEFGSALWRQIDPITALKSMNELVVHPLKTLSSDASARQEVYDKAENAFKNGHYTEGAAHLLYAAIPFLGPQLDAAGEDFSQGRYARGAGTSVGMGLALAGPKALAESGVVPKTISATADVVSGGWRKIGNPFGLASTGEELLTQGISPRTSMVNFKGSLERAAGDLQAYDAQSRINSVQDLHDAIPEIKQKIWNEEIEPALQRQAKLPVDMQPVADAVRAQISDEMRTFDEANADKLDTLATKLESAKDVTSANKLLKYANGQLESYFQKFPAARRANLMANPETAGWEAARSELRNQFLSTLEDAGETGVRDARLRYGAFDTLQDAVERRINVADRAKPMSLARIVGLAGALPTGGLSVVAGEISNYLNKPDVLVRRGVSKMANPVRTTPFPGPTPVSPVTGVALATPGALFNRSLEEEPAR